MSLTSYRAAPPRASKLLSSDFIFICIGWATDGYRNRFFVIFYVLFTLARLEDLAATYSPTP